MGGKMDKPDYVDQDWTSLTEVKTAKWADMMEKIKEEGWVITELRTDMGFTSRLALKPVHEGKRRGIFVVCAGGAFLFKSSNEAKPVAEYFYRAGINVAILDYHVDPAKQKDSDKLDVRISAGEDGVCMRMSWGYVRIRLQSADFRPAACFPLMQPHSFRMEIRRQRMLRNVFPQGRMPP